MEEILKKILLGLKMGAGSDIPKEVYNLLGYNTGDYALTVKKVTITDKYKIEGGVMSGFNPVNIYVMPFLKDLFDAIPFQCDYLLILTESNEIKFVLKLTDNLKTKDKSEMIFSEIEEFKLTKAN